MIKQILAWDLGATKCAAGIVELNTETGALTCKKNYAIKLADTTSLADLIAKIEIALAIKVSDMDAVCIGGAGQYDGETLILEGIYPYEMCFAKTAVQQNWPAFTVIHDYAPIVCATFTTYMQQSENIKRLNSCALNPYGRRVALGIGTGLGMKDGVLLENGDFWLGKNEVGHIGITTPPAALPHHLERHRDLMAFLHDRMHINPDQAITFERILSGQGIVRLYQFFHTDDANITPEEVGMKMRDNELPEVKAAFVWYIGLLVGTVQLTFMPEGGIWITGGVVLNHLEAFDLPDFHEGIYASPAYRVQREEYPLGILCNQEHALMGSGYYASKRLIGAIA